MDLHRIEQTFVAKILEFLIYQELLYTQRQFEKPLKKLRESLLKKGFPVGFLHYCW
jgi:hypothetical protein